jgi:Icc-related predicted phosphoesterase
MKFVSISDTHGQHAKLTLPKGDVIIHAGDISSRGHEREVLDFIKWFANLDFRHKIFIAGNHDFYFERHSDEDIKKIIPDTITYLCDSGTTIDNINIWGSPITPWFFDWAFNRHRGNEIARHWDLIPTNTNILITHGPVFGLLDKTTNGQLAGCQDLLEKVNQIKPRYHICGHIHEGYGNVIHSGTHFINASVLDENYQLKNKAIVFEL